MRLSLLVALVAGCYRPEPAPGAPCGAEGACPGDLVCRGDRCVDPATPNDAPGGIDAPAPPVDAPPVPVDANDAVGCADGEREAFVDLGEFPDLAGCGATWTGALSMRAARTGATCGDDGAECTAPADACAPGWHVCGTAGEPAELSDRVTAAGCNGAVGRFVTAMSHCSAFAATCEYVTPLPCAAELDCSEPVCCGDACRTDAGCPDGVFPMATRIGGTLTNGCAAMLAAEVTGVLCCR